MIYSRDPLTCPLCESVVTTIVGPIFHPKPASVAGVPLDLGDTQFNLRRCPTCGFQFKTPAIAADRLLACYVAADSTNWGESPDPRQRKFDVLHDVLCRHAKGTRVLDVGCFNGAMLDYFGGRWNRFGVDPSLSAAELARRRNILVLADSIENISASEPPFDAIFAIDVLEHFADPVPFLRTVAEHLTPDGVFIVLTGNTDSLAWRLQGSMFWYCSLPEHVSFYNRTSLEKVAELVGMRVVEFTELRHKRLPVTRSAMDATKSAVYVAVRAAGGLGLPLLRRRFVERRGPSIQTAKDHLLAVLRKVELHSSTGSTFSRD